MKRLQSQQQKTIAHKTVTPVHGDMAMTEARFVSRLNKISRMASMAYGDG